MSASATTAATKAWPSFHTSAWGLACFLLLLEGFKIQRQMPAFEAGICLLLAIAIPIMVAEAIVFKSYQHPDTGLDFSTGTPLDLGRVGVKLLGLYASMLLIGLGYFLYPEYHDAMYRNYWRLLSYLIPATVILAIPYVCLLDKYLVDKHDANWHAGMLVLGRTQAVDKAIFKNHILGWLVKGFFLALMFTYFIRNIDHFQKQSVIGNFWKMVTQGNPYDFYHSMVTLIFTIDLAYVSLGYLLTFKLLNSHIRTVEPTFLGWAVALACYHPFWDYIGDNYLPYNNDGFNFDNWLGAHPIVLTAWGITVILLLMVYVWATIQFGIRFSNLTHRGIITNGPYKFCKHPAYVSKNLSWWLIAVPFISTGNGLDAVKNCLLLATVNLIYYLRAKTEEAHLGKDSAYQAYLAHMRVHSLYSKIRRWMARKLAVAR
jgi:isoprenylcysteine carboxyl methyltransferase (ICMT) family protein YpbQ